MKVHIYTNLAEALPPEIERCKTIKKHADEIGPAGMLLSTLLADDIKTAEQATRENDTVGMLRSLYALKEYKE